MRPSGNISERAGAGDGHRNHRLRFHRRRCQARLRELEQLESLDWEGDYRRLKADCLHARPVGDPLSGLFALLLLGIAQADGVAVRIGICRMAEELLHGRSLVVADVRERHRVLLLAAVAATLTTEQVHLVVASDHEQQAFMDWALPIVERLGLAAAGILATDNPGIRRRKYRSALVWVTPRELALDVLRDQLHWPDRPPGLPGKLDGVYGPASRSRSLMIPGLQRAFVDRLDRVLIDEARTPVMIGSEESPYPDRETLTGVYALLSECRPDQDYTVDVQTGSPVVPAALVSRVAQRFPQLLDHSHGGAEIEQLIRNGLRVCGQLQEGTHYQRRGDRILIPGLIPGQGHMASGDLVQVRRFLECREAGARVMGEDILGRTSYLRLFNSYRQLSGTALAVDGIRRDFRRLYGLRFRPPPRGRQPVQPVSRIHRGFDPLVAAIQRAIRADPTACWVCVTGSAGSRDRLLEPLRQSGPGAVGDRLPETVQSKGNPGCVVVMARRDVLPLCADPGLWSGFARVNLILVGMPVSFRQAAELALPVTMGGRQGRAMQWMIVDSRVTGDDMQVPERVRWLGPLAASAVLRPGVRLLLGSELRRSERREHRLRMQWQQHQASIDELLAFSGKNS